MVLDVLQETTIVFISEQQVGEMLVLQHYSGRKWNKFVDVGDVADLQEGDRLALTLRVSVL